jgi:hypothetical protein
MLTAPTSVGAVSFWFNQPARDADVLPAAVHRGGINAFAG